MDSDTGGKAKTAAGFSGCVQIQVAQPISQLTALTTMMKEISWVGHLHTRTANVRRYLIITNIKKNPFNHCMEPTNHKVYIKGNQQRMVVFDVLLNYT